MKTRKANTPGMQIGNVVPFRKSARDEVRFTVTSGTLTIGDPCYLTEASMKQRSLVHSVSAKKGEWIASVTRTDKASDNGERIATLTVRHANAPAEELIDFQDAGAKIGVDSGMAGAFDMSGIPGMKNAAGSFTSDLCFPAVQRGEGLATIKHGAVCESGLGDGFYRLERHTDAAEVDAVRLDFAPFREPGEARAHW
jgi:hypothetical protein